MMEIITAFKKRSEVDVLENIRDRVGYICKMIAQGTSLDDNASKKSKNNSFNNFEQRDDDIDLLEKKLLGN